MNKTLGVVLLILFIPAGLFSFGLYEKWHLKKENTIIERTFKKDIGIENTKPENTENKPIVANTPILKEIIPEVEEPKIVGPFEVSYFQKGSGSDFQIIWKLKNSENIDSVSILTCKQNFSVEYDESWYELSAYNKWNNSFVFNTKEAFNNLCHIPYKIRYHSGENIVLENEFKIYFPWDNLISESESINVLKYYFPKISLVQSKNKVYVSWNKAQNKWDITKEDCSIILNKSTTRYWRNEICTDSRLTLSIEKVAESVYIISINEVWLWGDVIFRRALDLSTNKEIHNLDKQIHIPWQEYDVWNHWFFYNIDWSYLLTTAFIYDLSVREKKLVYNDFNWDVTHFYKNTSWLITLEEPVTWDKYYISGIPESEFHRHFIVKDWYLAIIWDKFNFTKENYNIYYAKLLKDKQVKASSIDVKALILWCWSPPVSHLEINNWILKNLKDCNLGLEMIEFDLIKNELISKSKYRF